jgi:RecB family exonuclease
MTPTAVAASPPNVATVPLLDHLSWSGIQTYRTCPRKFQYRYLLHAPEEFIPASLMFGAAIHRAVDALHQAQVEGRPLPTPTQLLSTYRAGWQELLAEVPNRPVLHAKGEDETLLAALAERMLDAFCKFAQSTVRTQIFAIEHEQRFKIVAEAPPIEARIDLLELAGNDLIVTDVKTSRSRWNDQKVQEHLPQLVLYAHGLMPLLKHLGASRFVPRFVVITKAKKPAVQVIEPKASQADAGRLKQQIVETWQAIKAGIFVQRESWACSQCPYRSRCLGT